jgi:hypothetical protein
VALPSAEPSSWPWLSSIAPPPAPHVRAPSTALSGASWTAAVAATLASSTCCYCVSVLVYVRICGSRNGMVAVY